MAEECVIERNPNEKRETKDIIFRIASDIHLERQDSHLTIEKRVTEEEDNGTIHVLGLLGDIGNPKSLNETYGPFIAEQATKGFNHVLLLSGNHEYYANVSLEDSNNLIEAACNEAQRLSTTNTTVPFMWRKRVEISDFIFLGVTLWTHIKPSDEATAISRMTDFRKINYDKDALMTVQQYQKMHSEDVSWLMEQIKWAKSQRPGKPVVVLSHQAPTFQNITSPVSNDQLAAHSGGCRVGIASSLEHMMVAPVILWCHGHTHYSNDQLINNAVRVISNQKGYSREEGQTGYDSGLYLRLSLPSIEFWLAISQKHLHKAKQILAELTAKESRCGGGAVRSAIEFRWVQSKTPLMQACAIGSARMVSLLLEHNADVNAQDKNNHSGSWWNQNGTHSSTKKKKIQALLVSAGASPVVEDGEHIDDSTSGCDVM